MAHMRTQKQTTAGHKAGANARGIGHREAGGSSSPLPLVETLRRAPVLTAIALMAVIGLGISIYLTVVHYDTKVALVCTSSNLINCGNVTTSAYSVIPFTTIPVTIPGMVWFAVSGGLALVGLWRLREGRPEPEHLRLAQAIWGLGGLLFVIYLIYCEIVLVHNICEWCTAVHALTFLTFILAFYRLQRGDEVREFATAQPTPVQSASTRQARQMALSRRARRFATGATTRKGTNPRA